MIDHRMPASRGSTKSTAERFGEEAAKLLSPKPLHEEVAVESVLFWIKSPLRTRFFVVCAAIFSNMFQFGLFIGLAPYYRDSLELNDIELGSLFTANSFLPLFMIPVLGLCIDKTPQKLFFGLGGGVCALSSLIMASFDDSYWGILCSRLLHGCGATVVWLTGPAVVHEVFAIPSSTKAMGIVYIYATAAFLAGTVMGSNSFDWAGTTMPIYSATFLMNICTTVFVLGSLPPDEHSARDFFTLLSKHSLQEGWAEYRVILKKRTNVLLLLNVLLFSVATVVLQTFIPSWVLYSLGTTVSGAADIYAVMAVAKLSSQPFFGRMTERMNPHYISAGGVMAYGVMLPLLSLAWNVLTIVVVFALVGLCMTAALLPTFISLSNFVESSSDGSAADTTRRYTLANSLWLFFFMVGSTVAPVGVGAILGMFPEEGLHQHVIILGLLGAVMALIQGPLYLMFASAEQSKAEIENAEKKQYC